MAKQSGKSKRLGARVRKDLEPRAAGAVKGGSLSSVGNALKSIGEGIATVARKG